MGIDVRYLFKNNIYQIIDEITSREEGNKEYTKP